MEFNRRALALGIQGATSRSPDLQKLVRDAQARFEALSPEQKRAHVEAQKKSWVVGETMLSHPEMTREEAEALYEKVINRV
jgi:hypothetical protein